MLLDLSNVGKSYTVGSRSVKVLSGINLQIRKGDYISIMGTSGSGKSTFLHILGTLLRPDSGTYLFEGEEIHRKSDKELAWIRAHWIGYVFQTFDLLYEQSVEQNIALPYLYRNQYTKKQIALQVDQAIELVGLQNRRTHRPNELSGGEMQRTAIARAIAAKPKLILADEPTGNLDESNSGEIMNLFHDLNQIGSTLILVTHDKVIAEQSHRTLQMKNGRTVPHHV